jgi:protein phosphatase
MKVRSVSISHIGKVREKNEDAYCRCEPRNPRVRKRKGILFIVADGMGGHSGGEIASKVAVETIKEAYYADENGDPGEALVSAFEEANKNILERALQDVSLFGMGTTCTAMAVVGGKAYFAHIGDSRAYLLRKGDLQQITKDHSLVGDMVRSGMISQEDAKNHPQRNIITKSLGSGEKANPDTPSSPLDLEKGDVFLLCSDGLTGFVSDEEIKEILCANKPKEACKMLVDLANERGGRDNITIQIITAK